MAETSSLSYRNPCQCLHSMNAWAPFNEKALLSTDFCCVASPSQNSVPEAVWKKAITMPAELGDNGAAEQAVGGVEVLFRRASFAIVATSCRECRALRAQNAGKVSKRSSRVCRPGVPKKCRKRKVPKRDFFVTFRLFRHFFGTPGRQAQDNLFETFSGILGPEGLALPVTGRYNRKASYFDG